MLYRLIKCWLFHKAEVFDLAPKKYGPQPKMSRFCRKCGIYIRWKI